MAQHLCGPGALLCCSCGSAAAPLTFASRTLDVAHVLDSVPLENIQPFGLCSAPGRPPLTACIPATTEPWSPGGAMRVEGVDTIGTLSVLRCAWGGLITIVDAGQDKVKAHG